MDVDRYEKDLAALTDSGQHHARSISAASIAKFGNARLYTWTLGLERKFGNLTADAAYVGTAAQQLPRYSFPNAYPGATRDLRPTPSSIARGTSSAASESRTSSRTIRTPPITRCRPRSRAPLATAVRASRPATPGASRSTTPAWCSAEPAQPEPSHQASRRIRYDTHPEKGPSNFDVTHGFGLSARAGSASARASDSSSGSAAKSPRDGRCSASRASVPARRSRSTPGFSRPATARRASTVPTRLPSRSSPRRARIAQDYFGQGGRQRPRLLHAFPIHLAGGTGPNQGRFGTLGTQYFPRSGLLQLRLRIHQRHALRPPQQRSRAHGPAVPRRVLQPVQHREHGPARKHPGVTTNTSAVPSASIRHEASADQQDSRHIAPDPVLAQVDLLEPGSPGNIGPILLWYKGPAFHVMRAISSAVALSITAVAAARGAHEQVASPRRANSACHCHASLVPCPVIAQQSCRPPRQRHPRHDRRQARERRLQLGAARAPARADAGDASTRSSSPASSPSSRATAKSSTTAPTACATWPAGTPMTKDTIFRDYSMTKPVTGVAMMILYERASGCPAIPSRSTFPSSRT